MRYPLAQLPPVTPAFPPLVNLQSKMPEVWDQGIYNTCTVNAIGSGLEYVGRWNPRFLKKQSAPSGRWIDPSRFYLYHFGKYLAGFVDSDPGLSIPDGLAAAQQFGYPPENEWPYVPSNLDATPPWRDPSQASHLVTFQRLPLSIRHIQFFLWVGWPIVFGFCVDGNFERYFTSHVNGEDVIQRPIESEILGTHALLACGYDANLQCLRARNSWGESWGQRGYCWIPFDVAYDPNLGFDFFAIQVVKL